MNKTSVDDAGYTKGPVSDGGMDPRDRESAKSVVTDEMVLTAIRAWDGVAPQLEYCHRFRAALEAVAPMLASARVPDGWQLVPVEATDEMCEAAWESDASDYVGEHRRIHRADLAYKAMLAAAPKEWPMISQREARALKKRVAVLDTYAGAGAILLVTDRKVTDDEGYGEVYIAPMQVSARKSCDLCDCTGDIHDQTGEWRGECPYCKTVSAQVPSVGITLCRHCEMPEMNCDCPDSSGFLRTLPRSYGVSRMDENDNVVLVSFCRRLTDDELRTLHIMLAAAPKPETNNL